MSYAVIMPTFHRVARARLCIQRLVESMQGRKVGLYLVLNADDSESLEAFEGLPRVIVPKGSTAVFAWNEGLRVAARDPEAQYFVLGADDLAWRPGWLDAVMKVSAGAGYIGLNTLEYEDRACTHYVLSRDFIVNVLGGVLIPPPYKHCYSDKEVFERAKKAGAFVYCKDAVVEHLHPAHGKADMDETYTAATAYDAEDRETYYKRLAAGFPNDYEPVIAMERMTQAAPQSLAMPTNLPAPQPPDVLLVRASLGREQIGRAHV